MGHPEAQRDDARSGVQDEQGGVPHLRREQERRVLRLRKVRCEGGEITQHKHEPPLMPKICRMVGPIQRGEHSVSWSSLAESPKHRRASRSSVQSASGSQQPPFFSPNELRYEESPMPVSPDPPSQSQARAAPPSSGQRGTRQLSIEPQAQPRHSAPPEMHHAHRQLSRPAGTAQSQTIDDRNPQYDRARSQEMQARVNESIARNSPQHEVFELDPRGPLWHMREHSAPPQSAPEEALRWGSVPQEALGTVVEEGTDNQDQEETGLTDKEGPSWGETFKVQWIRTDRLPFYRTRHLRNPWNHDREVKVSRDGTELEPSVGQALLDEWEKPAPPPPVGTPSGERRPKAPAAEEAPPDG